MEVRATSILRTDHSSEAAGDLQTAVKLIRHWMETAAQRRKTRRAIV
jgi:hypothetical protein